VKPEPDDSPVEAAQRVALIATSTARMALDLAESIVADRERFARLTDSGRAVAGGVIGDLVRLAGFGGSPAPPAPPAPPDPVASEPPPAAPRKRAKKAPSTSRPASAKPRPAKPKSAKPKSAKPHSP